MTVYCIFFFKQKTAYEMRISDWSSDVCSSDLERYRNVDGFHNCFDDIRGELHVAHQRRARPAVDDLAHRAAHVDVDDRGALVGGELGRLAHFVRGAADELHRHGLFKRMPRGLLDRLAGFAARGLRSEEHTSELTSLIRHPYAVLRLKKKQRITTTN